MTLEKSDYLGAMEDLTDVETPLPRVCNATCRERVAAWPVFLVARAEFFELSNALRVTEQTMLRIFGSFRQLSARSDRLQTLRMT